MIRWICGVTGVKPGSDVSFSNLCAKLGIEEIESALRSRRLRWYGYVLCAISCINTIRNMWIPGGRRGGGQSPGELVSDEAACCLPQ